MKKVTAVLAVVVLVVSMVSLVFAGGTKKGTIKSIDSKAGTVVFSAEGANADMTLKVDKSVDLSKVKAGDKVEATIEKDTLKQVMTVPLPPSPKQQWVAKLQDRFAKGVPARVTPFFLVREEAVGKTAAVSQKSLICRGVCFIIGVRLQVLQIIKKQSNGEEAVIKVNQEELKQKIAKLKKEAAEKKAKAEGKKADPAARKARKKVKRAQRKLRAAKAYKSARKKASEAKAAAPAPPSA